LAYSSTFMQKFRTVPFFCRFLLLILLTASIDGKFSCAHAMQRSFASAHNHESSSLVSAMHRDKKNSSDHHKHSAECNVCSNCLCHLLLPAQTIKLDYSPVVMSFCSFKPLTNLTEVMLSMFIPPRNVA